VLARYSAPVKKSSEAHPASYIVGSGSFLGLKPLGELLTAHPHLAPSLKKDYSCTSAPPVGLRGLFEGEILPLPLPLLTGEAKDLMCYP